MELRVSGRSAGLAAASAIDDFSLRDGTIIHRVGTGLARVADPALPFGILALYVEALGHGTPNAVAIHVRSRKKLLRAPDGALQKLYEFTIGNTYYRLDRAARDEAIHAALLSIADSLHAEFPSPGMVALTQQIRDGVHCANPRQGPASGAPR